MLPDRSKRYAGIDGEIPRLGLVTNWQLFLLGLLVLALLVLIFPRKALVEKLYAQDTLDELTLSYVQNLYRADTSNPDVAILLARIQQDLLPLDSMESLLLPLASGGDERQRADARALLFAAYQKALKKMPADADGAPTRQRLILFMQTAARERLPESMARAMATAAFAMHSPDLALKLLNQLPNGVNPAVFETYAREALSMGDYEVAANYFFRARGISNELAEQRRLFKIGIDTLMSNSMFTQAMQAATDQIGGLARDPATVRYLANTARSAGQPHLAAQYARALVALPPSSGAVAP